MRLVLIFLCRSANKNHAINSLIGAAFGGKRFTFTLFEEGHLSYFHVAAGQRCMAISVAVLVGDAQAWLPDLIKAAQGLKVSGGFEKGADLYVLSSPHPVLYLTEPCRVVSGPVISPASKERILGHIASAEQEGGTIHLDGRGIQVEGYEHGNFIGPTIIEANTSMRCYQFVKLRFTF